MVLIILREKRNWCDILSFLLCINLNKKGAFIVATLVSKKTKKPKTDSPKETSEITNWRGKNVTERYRERKEYLLYSFILIYPNSPPQTQGGRAWDISVTLSLSLSKTNVVVERGFVNKSIHWSKARIWLTMKDSSFKVP